MFPIERFVQFPAEIEKMVKNWIITLVGKYFGGINFGANEMGFRSLYDR